jgi:hypothetical protein
MSLDEILWRRNHEDPIVGFVTVNVTVTGMALTLPRLA